MFNDKSKQYICWLKLSGRRNDFVILTAKNILGPYKIVRDKFRPFGFKAGDFDIWKNEETGEAYLYFEHDHNGVIATQLTDDYLDVKEPYKDMFTGLKPPFTREGITHFVYNNKHYILSSGMTGYIPNPSEAAISDNPLGPYEVIGNPNRNDDSCASFNSQVSCVFKDPQRENSYIVLADRWVPEYIVTKERYEQIKNVVASVSYRGYRPKLKDYFIVAAAPFLQKANTSIARYVWLPMQFEGEMPVIEWHDKWTV